MKKTEQIFWVGILNNGKIEVLDFESKFLYDQWLVEMCLPDECWVELPYIDNNRNFALKLAKHYFEYGNFEIKTIRKVIQENIKFVETFNPKLWKPYLKQKYELSDEIIDKMIELVNTGLFSPRKLEEALPTISNIKIIPLSNCKISDIDGLAKGEILFIEEYSSMDSNTENAINTLLEARKETIEKFAEQYANLVPKYIEMDGEVNIHWTMLYNAFIAGYNKAKNTLYSEEEMRLNPIYCVSELVANPKGTSEEMKIWNDKTNEWFKKNKK